MSKAQHEGCKRALKRVIRENTAKADEIGRLVDDLEDMVLQQCSVTDNTLGTLDSMAISANRDAMLHLAEHGRLEILHQVGRRVIARHALAEIGGEDEDGYRDMARDAGYDPDSDEGRQMAAAIEEQHRKEFEAQLLADQERRLAEETDDECG